MDISLEPGVYVVAVSGGVDSIVLLHLLMQQYGSPASSPQSPGNFTNDKQQVTKNSNRKFVVAHFDHGIRSDSYLDRQLVQEIAASYQLPFVFHEGKLGPGTSEEEARNVRYKFLRAIQKAAEANAIVTAHHQDDVLETAIFNLNRGTSHKGLASVRDTPSLRRPLLGFSKQQIRDYAEANGLKWREDTTNQDLSLSRNFIRHTIIPRLSATERKELLEHIQKAQKISGAIEEELSAYITSTNVLNRSLFNSFPHAVSREVMAAWLRYNGIRQFDQKLLERLVTAAKTMQRYKKVDAGQGFSLYVDNDGNLALTKRP